MLLACPFFVTVNGLPLQQEQLPEPQIPLGYLILWLSPLGLFGHLAQFRCTKAIPIIPSDGSGDFPRQPGRVSWGQSWCAQHTATLGIMKNCNSFSICTV